MPFSKCLRAKKYSNMNVYFDPQGCQTLLLKESDPLLFPLGSWTINKGKTGKPSFSYDRTLVARTLMAHLPWLFRTHS